MVQRAQLEERAELKYKGTYCRHTAPNGSIDHGMVDEVAFWDGEYIIQMNGRRITIEEDELDNELEILQHGLHSGS